MYFCQSGSPARTPTPAPANRVNRFSLNKRETLSASTVEVVIDVITLPKVYWNNYACSATMGGPQPLPTALLQLLLPPQHPRLVAFRLGLGNHSLLLIQDREAGVRQNVVGIDTRDLLGNFDGFVEAVEVLQRPPQSMQPVGELRIGRHRLPVLFDRLLVVAFTNQIKRGIVGMFGQFAGGFGAS